jgi:hypothetical protein
MKNMAAVKSLLSVTFTSGSAKFFIYEMIASHVRVILFIALSGIISLASLSCTTKRPIGPIGPDGRQLTWAEMNIEHRKAHMKQVVLPRAAEVFQVWRPERFGRVECSLCHGTAEKTGNFHMPTDHLPRLSGDALLRQEREKFPETTQLKLNRLVPVMAEALGEERFNLITRRGFGCYSCHLGPEGPMFGH